jgi:uncharacterized protein YndB with AHSA1/START domain
MKISIETTINSTLEKVWNAWVTPAAITKWNFASDQWVCPRAEVNLEEGSDFNYRMESKDGSMGFDFKGTFTQITAYVLIEYKLEDERRVMITFDKTKEGVRLVE